MLWYFGNYRRKCFKIERQLNFLVLQSSGVREDVGLINGFSKIEVVDDFDNSF